VRIWEEEGREEAEEDQEQRWREEKEDLQEEGYQEEEPKDKETSDGPIEADSRNDRSGRARGQRRQRG